MGRGAKHSVCDVYPKIESGEVKPTIYKTLPITEAQATHDILYRGENFGNVVTGGIFAYCTLSMLIFSFFSRNAYATKDTMLSKAFPMPKRSAIPVSVGVHTFVA